MAGTEEGRGGGAGPGEEPFRPVTLETAGGPLSLRYYPAAGARAAAVYAGGVGGGWDTPSQGLYPRLSEELAREGIAGVRVRFRHPTVLDEAVADVLAAARFLREEEGVGTLGLVGHSFGGAVVIRAAAEEPAVATVVTLATQGYGTEPVARLGPRCSILLVHGTGDEVLAAASSQHVHALAREPRQLVVYPAAGHGLDEVAADVYDDVRRWLRAALRPEG
ncbi:MAG TPA: dienelactone hydrolase family protein [Longimicrobiaceae bacterium]|nr:dienelactone hydrolase family protein [Longimicrobiaceae bacterium]